MDVASGSASGDLAASLTLAYPEMLMAIGAMALLMLGVFRGNSSTRLVAWGSVAILLMAAILVLAQPNGRFVGFGDGFVVDPFAKFGKVLVYLGSAVAVIMSLGFLRSQKIERFEFPLLILFATLGMSMMVSANDLIFLYMGIELQSLALYVLAAFNRNSLRSTEAGLKYFVLGALSSGLLLYGCSLIYGFTGTTNFDVLRHVIVPGEMGLGVIFGLVFLCAGLAFKVSAVPFHMWTPDVYEGSPTPVTALFSGAPKIAAMLLFVRVLMGPFLGQDGTVVPEWQQIIIVISILSMTVGAFAAIGQTNIKRLMAYSSIGHMGYILVGVAAGTVGGVASVLIYLMIYLAMTLGVFACILSMRRKEGMVEHIEELAGLSRNQPLMAMALLVLLFSLAGMPPLAGFAAKFFVFRAAIQAELYSLAIIGLLASVVGAYYYVRIVKIMYFDEPAEPFEQPMSKSMRMVLVTSTLFILFYLVFANPLLRMTEYVAKSLFL